MLWNSIWTRYQPTTVALRVDKDLRHAAVVESNVALENGVYFSIQGAKGVYDHDTDIWLGREVVKDGSVAGYESFGVVKVTREKHGV